MAGSYNHVIEEDGSLLSNETVAGMLENGGDVYEAVEEMYGMIWYLAHMLDNELPGGHDGSLAELVINARKNYKVGLDVSPTERFGNDG